MVHLEVGRTALEESQKSNPLYTDIHMKMVLNYFYISSAIWSNQ